MGLLLLFCSSGATAAAPELQHRVLRVAFPQSPGISEIDQYGTRKGILVDMLNEIAKYTNWEYDYVDVDPDNLITDFLDGKFDLMGGTFYEPKFEQYFSYPKYSMCRSLGVLLCRQDDDSIPGYDITALNGKIIGVNAQATEKIKDLKEFLLNNDLDCEIRYYTRDEMSENGDIYPRLRSGEVDLVLGNELEVGGEFRMAASFKSQPYYIVTNAGRDDIIEEMNMALKYILESNPDFEDEIYAVNFPDTKLADIQLNETERRYIEEKKNVTVAVIRDWHPLFCLDDGTDHHNGLIPDLLERILDFSGLSFTYVYAETYQDAIQMVQRGEVDMMGSYMDTDEAAYSEGLAQSRPYITLNNIVLKHKSVSYPGAELTVGVLAGRVLPADIEAAEIRSYATPHDMLEAVNSGEVDFIYGVSSTLEKEMQNHRYLNVVPVTRVNNNSAAAFAMAKPITPELITILNKAIGSLSTEEKATMLDRNLVSVGYSSLSMQEMIYANPVAFLLIFGAVLLLTVMGILLIVRSRMKNSLMQSELEAAQAKSQAKSEFLSRMSHEIRTPMNAIVGLTDLTCMQPDLPREAEKKLQQIRSSSQYLLSLINDILDMSRIENGKMEIESEDFSLSGALEALEEMMSTQAEQKSLLFHGTRRISHDWLVGDPIRLRQVLTNLLSNAVKFTPAGGEVSFLVEETECDGQTAAFRFSVRDNGVGIPPEEQKRIFVSFEQLGTSTARSVGTGLGLPISRSIARLMGGELQVKSEPGEGSEFYMTLRFPLGTAAEAPAELKTGGQERSLEGVRVLLAEDNDLNAEIAQELLATESIQVRRAANGKEAVDLFTASAPGEYQIILMDIRMPVMDGQEATRAIRACGRPDAGVPIIAMTANSFKEDEEAAREAGMTGFVPKPVDPQYLFTVLRENL